MNSDKFWGDSYFFASKRIFSLIAEDWVFWHWMGCLSKTNRWYQL